MVACVGCDQLTKAIAKSLLSGAPVLKLAGDLLRLQLAENRGAFLSLGAALPDGVRSLVFTLGVGIVLAALTVYAILDSDAGKLRAVAFALVAGGGLSNLLDRITYGGYVVDFLNVGLGGLRTGIFNVADMAVLTGVALLFVRAARMTR